VTLGASSFFGTKRRHSDDNIVKIRRFGSPRNAASSQSGFYGTGASGRRKTLSPAKIGERGCTPGMGRRMPRRWNWHRRCSCYAIQRSQLAVRKKMFKPANSNHSVQGRGKQMHRRKPQESQSRSFSNSAVWSEPTDIRRRTAAIRASWSEAERAHRRELSQRYAVVWQALVQ
jgi:hypothetical protein